MKIQINTQNKHNYIRFIYKALNAVKENFNFELEDTDNIPKASIAVDNTLVAYVAFKDGFRFAKYEIEDIKEKQYPIIFKYHYTPNTNIFDYSKYKWLEGKKMFPCGLHRWWENLNFDFEKYLNKKRNLDVIATMRWYNSSTPPSSTKPWVLARKELIRQAIELQLDGYNVEAGKRIPIPRYEKLLPNTKIGFLWSASAYLGWKIPEFTQAGVVMITEPLGKNYPLLNNSIFEHEKHCIFETNPKNFKKQAKLLLENPKKLKTMRKNVLELWKNKMCPEKAGEWYYKVITRKNIL